MSIIKNALIWYDDKDTTKICTHIVGVSEVKKCVVKAGKKEFISLNPTSKTDFDALHNYYMYKRECVTECKESHGHGQYKKLKIFYLGGKELFIFNFCYITINTFKIYFFIICLESESELIAKRDEKRLVFKKTLNTDSSLESENNASPKTDEASVSFNFIIFIIILIIIITKHVLSTKIFYFNYNN